MTPNEIRSIDPSRIESLTMASGQVVRVRQGNQCKGNICHHCGLPKNFAQINNQQRGNIVLRSRKKEVTEENNGKEKVEETVEINVEGQPQEESGKKEVLRGPDGKPLLIDIITGGKFGDEEQPQPQEQPLIDQNNNQQNNIQPQQEQNIQEYNDQQGMNQKVEQQFVPEQNEGTNTNAYEGQYNDNMNQEPNSYPQEQNQALYPPQEMNNENVQEQLVDPNMVNQNFQEGYEQIPEVNVPGEEQGYQNQNELYYDQNQGQENMYPNFEDNQQYQQQEYEQPMNVPQEQQEYYPETQPQMQQPIEQPVEPQVQPIEPQTQPIVQTPVPSTMQPPVQPIEQTPVPPTIQPPVQPIEQTPVPPTMQPPVETQIPPQTQPTMQPQVQTQIPAQVQPQMQPPVQPATQPQFKPTIPTGKVMPTQNYPKKQMVQIKFGFGMPKIEMPGMRPGIGFPQHVLGPHGPNGPHGPHQLGPHGPHGPLGPHGPHEHGPHGHPHGIGFIPSGQQKAFGPGGKRIVFNPVAEMMNVVHNVMAPIAAISAQRMGLRSNKPTNVNKAAQKEVSQGAGTQQGPVLRARRNVSNIYESNEQSLCPECAAEEFNNYYGYGEYDYNNNNSGYITNYNSQTYQGKSRGISDNFNFHEIVETSDNSKSYVVAKKGGVTVSYDH